MATFKTGLKISVISALFLAGSITTTARADHNNHSILPYVAIGVFASILHQNAHSHRYTRTTRRYSHSRHHGHNNHYGHGGHNSAHYKRKQHSHSSGGYSHKQKRH